MPRLLVIAAASGGLLAGSGVAGSAMPDDAVALGGAEAGTTVKQAPDGSRDDTRPAAGRPERVSRSSDRPSLSEPPAGADDDTDARRRVARERVRRVSRATAESDPREISDPRQIARSMLPRYGWSESEFACLDELWVGESNWEWDADNPTSSAYGIPQSLPGEKMASAGSDWLTNPATQIEWGLGYIRDSYGTPCSANAFKNANNWY